MSNPLSRVDVHELQSALDMAQDLPQVSISAISIVLESCLHTNSIYLIFNYNFILQTLVQVPDLLQLQSLVDRLKNVGEVLDVAITQHGDLHLKVSTTFVTVGSDYSRLRVVGVRGTVIF